MSRIVKLEAENVKRLRAVSITPEGSVVTIRGENGQGKTSVLDAIEYALAGEKTHPAEPIRRGAEKARVLLETDDGLVVERRWTAKGTYLEVRTKDGAKYSSPQKMLDGLVGRLSFDPLAFMREKPERQAEVLRQLVGVDTTLLDAKRRQTFDARTDVNRRVAATKARLDATPVVDAPDAPQSLADLLAEQEQLHAQRDANEGKRRALSAAKERYREVERRIAAGKGEIARLEKALADARALLAADEGDLATAEQHGKALRSEVEALIDPDLDAMAARLRDVEVVNDRVRQKKARATLAGELAGAEAEAAKLSAQIDEIDVQKAAVLEQAAFPVQGLGFGEGTVTFNGLALSQASAAEQLRVSVAIGAAANSKLRVMLVRDGSLLDSRSMRHLAELAEQHGLQVWIEVVGKGGVGVVIEDGQVEGAAAQAEKGAA
jgi:DNA repair exonuclease SbcCD ATPase subunit